jgi:hypothetical protein
MCVTPGMLFPAARFRFWRTSRAAGPPTARPAARRGLSDTIKHGGVGLGYAAIVALLLGAALVGAAALGGDALLSGVTRLTALARAKGGGAPAVVAALSAAMVFALVAGLPPAPLEVRSDKQTGPSDPIQRVTQNRWVETVS